jgi:hypothetical protein
MGASLDRNGADGKRRVLADLPSCEIEILACSTDDCFVSYTLVYGQNEIRMEGNESVVDLMRRKARELVAASHPHTDLEEGYTWGGTRKGWLSKKAAKAAGL